MTPTCLPLPQGVRIFVVGVTNLINETELRAIASEPARDHYFNSTSIANLEFIRNNLLKHVCHQGELDVDVGSVATPGKAAAQDGGGGAEKRGGGSRKKRECENLACGAGKQRLEHQGPGVLRAERAVEGEGFTLKGDVMRLNPS